MNTPKMFTFSWRGSSRQRKCDGFSVIDITVALGIVGIIALIVVPSMVKAREQTRTTEAESRVKMLAAAINQLAWDTGVWPNGEPRNDTADREVWNLDTTSAGLIGKNGDFNNWKGPYLQEIPLDPWGNPYFFDPDYMVDGVWRVAVGSFGPNGQGRNLYDEDNVYVLLD